jgi:hypothetical protein
MPPISQKRARRHTKKLGEPSLRGSRGFLFTQGATAYGRGHKAARRVDANNSRRDHRQHRKTRQRNSFTFRAFRDGQAVRYSGKHQVLSEHISKGCASGQRVAGVHEGYPTEWMSNRVIVRSGVDVARRISSAALTCLSPEGRSARLRSAVWRSQQGQRLQAQVREVVRAAGLEPAQAFRPYGFSYHYDFRRPRRCAVRREALCGLDYPFTIAFALGAARLVSTPSRYRAWLGIAI